VSGPAQLVFGTVVLASGNGFGLLIYIAAGFTALLLVALKRWIPFTTTMIRAAVLIVRQEKALVGVAACALLLQVGPARAVRAGAWL
jgi:hypothetical protein